MSNITVKLLAGFESIDVTFGVSKDGNQTFFTADASDLLLGVGEVPQELRFSYRHNGIEIEVSYSFGYCGAHNPNSADADFAVYKRNGGNVEHYIKLYND